MPPHVVAADVFSLHAISRSDPEHQYRCTAGVKFAIGIFYTARSIFAVDEKFNLAGSQTSRTSYPQIRTVTPRAERSPSPPSLGPQGPRPAATSTGVVHLVELEVTRLALAQCDPVQIGADGGLLVTLWSLPLAQAAR